MPRLILPFIAKAPDIAGASYACGMSAKASEFNDAWLVVMGARASAMTCDERLTRAAQRQADWLAVHDFTKDHPHLGENGITANERARAEGYRLPPGHAARGNNIESALHYFGNHVTKSLAGLMTHDTHREHMFCLNGYSNNTVYGMGAREAVSGGFFVFVSSPPEGT